MSTFDAIPADSISPAELHAAFALAFSDYLAGPFKVTLEQWPQLVARQGTDIGLSRVTRHEGEVVAFCLVAPRPECDSWRLAAMGAVPAARGSGAAQALLDDFLERARTAGVASVELECFAQNTRALRLYESRGWEVIDELPGYTRAAGPVSSAPVEPVVVELADAFAWLDASLSAGIALPLQVTTRSLRALPEALHAWRHGNAQVMFSQQPSGPVVIHSLVDRDTAQRDAEGLVAALLMAHPSDALRVPQLQRRSVGGEALERLGFGRLPLHQVWMRRPC